MSFLGEDFFAAKRAGTRRRFRAFTMAVVLAVGSGMLLTGLLALFHTRTDTASPGSPRDGAELYQLYDEMMTRAVEKVQPAIVSVSSSLMHENGEEMTQISMGSGIIFKKDKKHAWIVTNAHVIDTGDYIDVTLMDGSTKKSTLVGSDDLMDLAVLQVDAKGISHVARFGDSSKLKAGATAIAIGNPLGLGHVPSISAGVISVPKREVSVNAEDANNWRMTVIQTDAAINQGNSGGALINLAGEVIGINSLKVFHMGVEGLGFAIPSNDALAVIEDLLKYGKVKRPYLGVYTENVEDLVFSRNSRGPYPWEEEWLEERLPEDWELPDDIKYGVIVMEAVGPARESGLAPGDIIVALDGHTVRNTYELRKYIYDNKQIGDKVKVRFYRDGKYLQKTVRLGEME